MTSTAACCSFAPKFVMGDMIPPMNAKHVLKAMSMKGFYCFDMVAIKRDMQIALFTPILVDKAKM